MSFYKVDYGNKKKEYSQSKRTLANGLPTHSNV